KMDYLHLVNFQIVLGEDIRRADPDKSNPLGRRKQDCSLHSTNENIQLERGFHFGETGLSEFLRVIGWHGSIREKKARDLRRNIAWSREVSNPNDSGHFLCI